MESPMLPKLASNPAILPCDKMLKSGTPMGSQQLSSSGSESLGISSGRCQFLLCSLLTEFEAVDFLRNSFWLNIFHPPTLHMLRVA